MDETGLRIGVGRGQWVVVFTGQKQGRFINLIGSYGDTEYIFVIESIFIGSIIIIPLIIIKGVIIQARQFSDIRDSDIAINVFDSGYFNNFLSF